MITQREPVYILIPVHNRKLITLKCLHTLKQNDDLERYYVVVIDDGSTDGTSQAIQTLYPEVEILQGDGNLWWTGAIKMGMEYAYEQGGEYFIWLNDDCYPLKDSIPKLLELCRTHPQTIVGGQCIDPDSLEPSYGGIVGQTWEIKPIYAIDDNVKNCDGLAGNFVCLGRAVVENWGYPDDKTYPHYCGDITYTNQLKRKAGYSLWVSKESKALCKSSNIKESWLLSDHSLINYWHQFFKIKSPHYWKAVLNSYIQILGSRGFFIYTYKRIIKFWIIFAIVIICPLFIRRQLKKLTTLF